MLDLGTLRLGIKVDSDAAKSELNSVGSQVESTGAKTESLASKAKTMIKAFAAAYAVKELVKLGKAALDAYAQFEQLEGGVQKLFGEDASKDVMKYAENAYKTAGLSANQYMEQVTSFSASLISSLDGDTAKAAKVADMAIRDMSDNANVFGTDMTSIQNAYAGFAKNNYTMLDNLKLGFSGSREGMEQLLAKAEEFSGVHYDISSLNDVYEAIHVVQQEMSITGTTAKEAATTIEGSTNQMKASWQNLLTSIGSGEGIDVAVENFLSSLGAMATNIAPRVVTIAGGIVKAVVKAIPKLMMSLANAISKFADTISSKSSGKYLNAGIKILKSLVKGLLKAVPALASALLKLANTIIKKFTGIDLLQVGKNIINSLKNGLIAAWDALKGWVVDKVAWIKSAFSGAKSSGSVPSSGYHHRIGLREVPYDGYQAILHKGETILSAAETNQYMRMADSPAAKARPAENVTINVYGSDGMNVQELAAAVERRFIQRQKRRTLAWQ